MSHHAVTAVVLPAAAGPGARRANIYLSPRLSGAHLLSAFPDWLTWTTRVHQHGLRFELACGAKTAVVTADPGPLRPDLWEAIFAHDALVEEYPAESDFSKRLVVSYPTRDTEAFVGWAYKFALYETAAGRVLGQRALEQILGELSFRDTAGNSTLDATLSQLRVDLWNEQNPPPVPQQPVLAAVAAPSEVTGPLPQNPLVAPAGVRPMAERLALFHRMPPAPGRAPLPSKPAELAKLIDFHKALTALAAYPQLLPILGLVCSVELPGGLCPDSPAAGAYLSVQVSKIEPGWQWAQAPALTSPPTEYVASATEFSAAPATDPATLGANGPLATADIVDGFLALTPADFHLVGTDVDGAMLKLMALAESWANTRGDITDEGLPSVRSGGLSLIADDRAKELLRAISDNAAFGTSSSRPLNARDLTRGYRLDVYSDRTARWDSLHRRDGTYRFGEGGPTVHTVDEEGFTQLGVAQPADDPTRPEDPVATAAGVPQPGTDLYLSERVARWNGWSLSAPRPAQPMNRSADPLRATDPDPTVDQPLTNFRMTSAFAVHPRSLPSLRFGHRYRIRARAVDLAGHSVPNTAHSPDGLVAPGDSMLPYCRFEPVGPPVVVLRTEPGPGGSLLELVIRSQNTDPSLDRIATAETDERHLGPPRVDEQLVERHGMLDDPAGRLRGDTTTYDELVARDRGTFPTVAIPSAGQVPLEPGPQLAIDYLADPLSRGVAFTGLPQTEPATDGTISGGVLAYAPAPGADPRPTAVTEVPFAGAWPARQAFRLRLAEGTARPAWDDANRVLTVSMPKALQAAVTLSSAIDARDLELMGVWEWLRQLFDALEAYELAGANAGPDVLGSTEARTMLTALTLAGGNELITPGHAITLTHAVQQPLGLPTFTRLPIVHNPADPVVASSLANAYSPLTAWRSGGSHHAVLLGTLQINGASTAAIDLAATWTEWIDDPDEPAPVQRPSAGPVDRITVTSLEMGELAADGSGSRSVAVYLPHVDALWFAAPFDALPGAPTPPEIAAPVHRLGDSRHRMVCYRATASSRFQEYFTEPGAVTSRTGPGLRVSVPSSARPLPPAVEYVVPLFGWDTQTSTDTKTQVRTGNALRVYLDRPWYSSGDGELLGVVLWPEASPPPTDDDREVNKARFTQWGLDPIWATGELPPVPSVGDFPLATNTGSGLMLEEGLLVDVAGHEVEFDLARKLWYCDIQLSNPNSYAPFVRLALVRFQPHSIQGVEVSKVTLADFAQLTSDRSAALTMDPADPTRARLVVAGLSPTGPTQSYFTATVEARRHDVLTDLGWETAAPGAARVTPDTPAPTDNGSVLMSATVTFAKPPPPGAFRVVIREFEVLVADAPAELLSDTPELAERLVFAAILPFDHPLEEVAP
jgi:hypothetical protein